jgi:hypothetical protein
VPRCGTLVVSAGAAPRAVDAASAWARGLPSPSADSACGNVVFLTDSAVNAKEENSLRRIVINLVPDVHDRVVPFLATKHTMDFCLSAMPNGRGSGLRRSSFLGGSTIGPPAVSHAWRRGRRFAAHAPTSLRLG